LLLFANLILSLNTYVKLFKEDKLNQEIKLYHLIASNSISNYKLVLAGITPGSPLFP